MEICAHQLSYRCNCIVFLQVKNSRSFLVNTFHRQNLALAGK